MTMCIFACDGETFIYKDELEPHACVTSLTTENSRIICEQPTVVEEPFYVCSNTILADDLLRYAMSDVVLATCRTAFGIPRELGGPREVGGPEVRVARFLSVAIPAPIERISGEQLPLFHAHMATRIVPAMTNHPAWRSGLGFLTGNTVGIGAIHTLHIIGDIMRFAQGDGRMKFRLRNFFRLSRIVHTKKLFNPEGYELTTGMRRLEALKELWTAPVRLAPIFEQADIQDKMFVDGTFLIKEHAKLMERYVLSGMSMEAAEIVASYKSSQRALDFIRLVWLHGIGEQEFDPYRFFKHEEDAKAFVRYAAQNS